MTGSENNVKLGLPDLPYFTRGKNIYMRLFCDFCVPKSVTFSFLKFFYRAMLCIRGTSHGPVSVCLSVRLSV